MMPMIPELIAISLNIIWILSHSVLATNYIKKRVPLSTKDYRLFYSIVAAITLGLLTVILQILSILPDLIKLQPIITPNNTVLAIQSSLGIIGVLIAGGAILQTNPFKFIGLIGESDKDLQTKYFYRVSRHPMYLGALILMVPGLFTANNSIWFIQTFIFVLYFIFGAIVEERRMKTVFDKYEEVMFTRGFLFPWKPSHFKILLGFNEYNY